MDARPWLWIALAWIAYWLALAVAAVVIMRRHVRREMERVAKQGPDGEHQVTLRVRGGALLLLLFGPPLSLTVLWCASRS